MRRGQKTKEEEQPLFRATTKVSSVPLPPIQRRVGGSSFLHAFSRALVGRLKGRVGPVQRTTFLFVIRLTTTAEYSKSIMNYELFDKLLQNNTTLLECVYSQWVCAASTFRALRTQECRVCRANKLSATPRRCSHLLIRTQVCSVTHSRIWDLEHHVMWRVSTWEGLESSDFSLLYPFRLEYLWNLNLKGHRKHGEHTPHILLRPVCTWLIKFVLGVFEFPASATAKRQGC